MKKTIILMLLVINSNVFSQNLQLASNLAYPGIALANIGGYVDSLGNEYALVGTYNGLDIVDVTVPTNPVIRFSVAGPQSDWREVKTYRKYAYITTEGGGGLTIVDLQNLPASINTKQYTGDGLIAGQLGSIHALHCDTAKGFLYLYGSDIDFGNTLFLNLIDPWNPVYSGNYSYPTGGSDAYVHDGYVLNDTMYEAHIYSGFFTVVDVRNKSNPVLLATQTTPTAFTHNTWLSDDHKTLFTTDENSGSFLTAYDITNLSNITELSRFQTTPGSGSIVHNTHILNDYAITSWYKDGVVIVDEARPRNPIEVARYDTYPTGNGDGFNGDWGVYPFLPSGNLVVSDIDNGLFVLTPTYMRGCYLEGSVLDSITNLSLSGTTVQILSVSINKITDALGVYRTGTVVSGLYDVEFSKPGYITKVISGVQLSNGVLTQLDVLLSPLQTYEFIGIITDSISGLPIANAEMILEGSGLTYSAISDINGIVDFPAVVHESYLLSAGKWGYHTFCSSVILTNGDSVSTQLVPGYYDDFTFDFGWTVNGSSGNAWERSDPIGTVDGGGTEINPENDITGDCGSKCFVTDNGGNPYNAHDVDNGNTILTSPVFDATIYADPSVNYYYRYLDINGTGMPNDTMFIRISNGITTVILDAIDPGNVSNGSWVNRNYIISNYLAPTSTMQVSVEVSDISPGNIVEGAFDQFEITGQLINGIKTTIIDNSVMNVFPNPFRNEISVSYNSSSSSELKIKDVTGRTVYSIKLSATDGRITLGKNLSHGIYFFILDDGKIPVTKKVVKN